LFKLLVTIGQKNLLWLALFILSALMIAYLILRYTPEYEAVGVLPCQNKTMPECKRATLKVQRTKQQSCLSIELMRSKVIINRVIDVQWVAISQRANDQRFVHHIRSS
jgi:hypothetical protein